MRIVQKYGGSSLADADRVRSAAERVAGLSRQGHRLVVVVSAQGDTTDRMLRRAARITGREHGREMDAYLAAGEQMSAALMAMAIGELGCRAVSFTGAQAGIITDDVYGNARITAVKPAAIEMALEEGCVAVVAGFQGVTERGDITTLGRGGSDTTAVALAAALGANLCQIYTDVDGVYDRDPRLFPDAVLLRSVGYDEMLTMARDGAQVLHDRCVELAKQAGIPIEVRSAFSGNSGTVVG